MGSISGAASVRPQLVADVPCRTGENPLWHADEGRIYWTDIPAGRLYRARADGTGIEQFDLRAPAGGFTIQEDGDLLLFMAGGAVRSWRDGHFTGTVQESLEGEEESRFNDVIADPVGRVFCGTMSSPSHAGRLYRLDPDGTIHLVGEGFGTPNRMGFSGDRSFFYQQDSRHCNIYRYRYDENTGEIGDREVLVHVDRDLGRGRPDGMTVDAEDRIWSARWDGGRVVHYSPDGKEAGEVLFPVRKVSCVTFGGEDLKTVFATTAGGTGRPGEGAWAGSLFRFTPGVQGRPEFRSRITSATRTIDE